MKLDEYISVGFCLSYGDGDYRVSMKVCSLSREKFNELKLTMMAALVEAEIHWRRTVLLSGEQAKSHHLPKAPGDG